MCFKRDGELPWSDNTAMGSAPKYGQGGEMTNRTKNGKRVSSMIVRQRNGSMGMQARTQPDIANPGNLIDTGATGANIWGTRLHTRTKRHSRNCSQNGSCVHFVHRAESHLIHSLEAARQYRSVINLDVMESVLTYTHRKLNWECNGCRDRINRS